jgi:hypothetical protein
LQKQVVAEHQGELLPTEAQALYDDLTKKIKEGGAGFKADKAKAIVALAQSGASGITRLFKPVEGETYTAQDLARELPLVYGAEAPAGGKAGSLEVRQNTDVLLSAGKHDWENEQIKPLDGEGNLEFQAGPYLREKRAELSWVDALSKCLATGEI